jgi:formate dehydrogenase iron-sulfur subunit
MAEMAILFDAAKCIACRACQVACKQWNELTGERTENRGTYENPPDLSAQTWVKMRFIEAERNGQVSWLFSRQACMHCTDAACVTVCPPKALTHHELGMVTYDKNLCTGCGYCADACPFGIPRSNRNLITGVAKMDKCTMCTSSGLDRVDNGYDPACVKTCPTGALVFGDRAELLAAGSTRVAYLKNNGSPNAYLYGEKELGGLHVLYALPDSPESYGLPVDPKISAVTYAWQDVIRPMGWALGGLTIVGLALNFMVARESKLSKELSGKKSSKEE